MWVNELNTEGLDVLLRIYMGDYALYATLLLTGSLGALAVLNLWSSTKRRGRVFTAAYIIFASVTLWSILRLMIYTRNIYLVLQRLNLLGLDKEIQGQWAWISASDMFFWAFQNVAFVIIVLVFVSIMFFLMWREVNKSIRESKTPSR